MGETGGPATDAMVATPLAMVVSNRPHVKDTSSSWKSILLLVTSCFWFCIMASLSFSIRFMSRRLFRVRREEDAAWHGDSRSAPTQRLEKRIEAGESEEEEDLDASKDQEAPVFQFRFSFFQVPEQSLSSGEGAVPSMATSISNYRVASERDLKGFLEATTMCVQESYMGSDGVVVLVENTEELDGEELRSRFSALKCSRQADSGAGEAVREEGEVNKGEEVGVENTEELDTDLKNRFSAVKYSCQARDGFLSERDFESEIDEENLFGLDSVDSVEDMIRHNSLTPTSLHDDVLLDGEAQLDLWQEPGVKEHNQKQERTEQTDEEKEEEEGIKSQTNTEDLRGSEAKPSCVHGCTESLSYCFSDSYNYKRCSYKYKESRVHTPSTPGTPNPKSDDVDQRDRRAPPVTDHSHNSQTSEVPVNPDHLLEENSYGQGQRWEDPLKEAHPQEGSDESQGSEGTHLSKAKELSMEESEELESLWEHQDLIDQLKMELKKVRSIGLLPTILEESESPKPTDDPKPWKFDAKFLQEDPMDELHKFYKSYRERMRKFDILNYQKMYTVGFLQLKDPLHSIGIQKPFIPTITSILSHNIWRRRPKCGTDPSEKFSKDLQSDLETVYVGQSCLSWEFLRWQYERTRELLDCDSQDGHQYNQVAGEFQQFQVLIQRFMEDEPFQGPRVPNYVKNRCVLRSLLQVPVIREDFLRDKIEEQNKWEEAVTCEQLEYVMESSMRVFWDFVKADKGDTPIIMKGLIGNPAELQDPMDRELMADIQSNLQKKEKKLKDILKSSGCLMKKFKKPQGGRWIQDDLFFSQVDLKLVSRVLKMARITTDQLVWCHKKLSKITFVERKLVRKPSFFLFPC